MAIDADATQRTINGSIDVLPEPTERVGGDAEPTANGSIDGLSESTEQVADAADTEHGDTDTDESSQSDRCSGPPGFRLALVLGLVAVVCLGVLAGWLGYGTYQAWQLDGQRNRFLAVGEQGAVNLTTIDYTEADADIQRILASSTGHFYDDFSKRAPAFIDLVKQAKSKTQGSITDAGVESMSGDSAQVLVAVAVNTINAGSPDRSTRHWRMRIDVQKAGDTVKVSNVGFVP